MFHISLNSSSGPQTPFNHEVEMQFATQFGLGKYYTREGWENFTKRKTWVCFSIEDETQLIGSWQVSMDPIFSNGQSRKRLWLRVTENHNNFHDNLWERTFNQVKSRSRKINVGIQKFNGHCKKVVDLKKNGYMKNDVLINACHLEGSNFALEYTWRLLKWLEQCIDTSSKRIKLSDIKDSSLPTTTGF